MNARALHRQSQRFKGLRGTEAFTFNALFDPTVAAEISPRRSYPGSLRRACLISNDGIGRGSGTIPERACPLEAIDAARASQPGGGRGKHRKLCPEAPARFKTHFWGLCTKAPDPFQVEAVEVMTGLESPPARSTSASVAAPAVACC